MFEAPTVWLLSSLSRSPSEPVNFRIGTFGEKRSPSCVTPQRDFKGAIHPTLRRERRRRVLAICRWDFHGGCLNAAEPLLFSIGAGNTATSREILSAAPQHEIVPKYHPTDCGKRAPVSQMIACFCPLAVRFERFLETIFDLFAASTAFCPQKRMASLFSNSSGGASKYDIAIDFPFDR
jgi:hypothetical protein